MTVLFVFGCIPVVTVDAAATYSVDDALNYAKSHWDDGKGLCAEFVSRCVIAGGLKISVQAGTGPCYRAIQSASGLNRQDLKLNSSGYATKALNGDNLAAGDVVIQWCKTHNIAPHIMICGGFDSSGYATYYAHNGALNNKRYKLSVNTAYDHTTSCDMGGQVIRISTLSSPVDATFSGSAKIYSNNISVGANLNHVITYNGTLQKVSILYGKSSDNLIEYSKSDGIEFTSGKYEIIDSLIHLDENTLYYYQICATVNGKEYKDTIRSFTTSFCTSNADVESVTESTYRVTIPEGRIIFCNSSPTANDRYRYIDTSSGAKTVVCTKRYVMTDKTVRYYFADTNNNDCYFRFYTGVMSVEEDRNLFVDVKENAYYYESVLWAVENKITTGTGNGSTFSPDMICTRAQVVTFLWRSAGSPTPKSSVNPFSDVSKDVYYYNAVLWAVENGITTGTGGNTFSPDMKCTRSQVVTFLWRTAGSPSPNTTTNPFEDFGVNEYYYNAVLWAVSKGITTGTGTGTFSPLMECSRGQIVTFLKRYAG